MRKSKYELGTVESHRRPIRMGLLSDRLLYGFLAFLVTCLSLIILPVLPKLGIILLFISSVVMFFAVYEYLPIRPKVLGIKLAIKNINRFWFSNNLIEDDMFDLDRYNSPQTVYYEKEKIIRAFCLPNKRKEMLSQETVDSLQAYLDSFNCDLVVETAIYADGFIFYHLKNSLEDDRLVL